jgi:DNA repair exonuclease SbcCD ATPase subunit
MLNHPFFTKYFPNAAQSLIKPDNNKKYMPFIISKDDPKTWEPSPIDNGKVASNTQKSRDKSPKEKSRSPNKVSTDNCPSGKDKKGDKVTKEKYQNLKEKYENLVKDYNSMKKRGNSGEPIDNELASLKNLLKSKEEKVAQLLSLIKNSKDGENNNDNESYLKMKVDELDKENETLKNKIMRYQQFIKNQQGGEIENNLRELRDSMANKDTFTTAIEKLKKRIDEDSKNNLNEIIKEKENELAKIKEEEKIRREKEKKKFTAIINKYDKTLNYVEKENKELKEKLRLLMAKNGGKK